MSPKNQIHQLLPNFKLWLQAKNYYPTTVKNYISDTNKYLRYAANQNPFSPPTLSAYIIHLSNKNNAKRYLASLNKFCQFAQDQNLTTQNNFKTALKIQKQTSPKPSVSLQLSDLVSHFKHHLSHQKRSSATIRNYINDLNQYITWLENEV